MPRRYVIAIASLTLFGCFALLSGGCKGTTASATPAEEVAAAAERYSEAKDATAVTITAEVTTEAEGLRVQFRGVSSYSTDGIVFSDERYETEFGPITGESHVIIVNGDLYMTPGEGDGDWFVLSPWHQGTRPEEIPDLGINALLADFERIARELESIRAHENDVIDGVAFKRYSGKLDWDSFAGEDDQTIASGTVDIDLWVDDESGLPFRMDWETEISRAGADTATLQATQTFAYDAQVNPPDPPANARPWRDLAFPDAPCTGEAFEGCLAAQTELDPVSVDSCEGEGRRICLVPIGNVSADLVVRLVEYYLTEYGLEIDVLTPIAAPDFALNAERNQIDAALLLEDSVRAQWPTEYLNPDAVIIGITPIDMYNSNSHFRYVFGIKHDYSFPKGIVSMFRMTPEFYAQPADPDLTFERTRKLVDKYIGLLYYGHPTTSNPASPMFDNILGPNDLDRMTERLPVSGP
ncbi:MAG: LppX_LprAFG lipoprotein [Dehalococcoidia bacterium]